MDAYGILVVVLSVLLAIFLILSIVVIIYILKIVKTIKEFSDKAVDVVESASMIRKFVSPAIIGRAIYEVGSKVAKGFTEDNSDKEEKSHGKKK